MTSIEIKTKVSKTFEKRAQNLRLFRGKAKSKTLCTAIQEQYVTKESFIVIIVFN